MVFTSDFIFILHSDIAASSVVAEIVESLYCADKVLLKDGLRATV